MPRSDPTRRCSSQEHQVPRAPEQGRAMAMAIGPVYYVRLSSRTRKVMLSPDTWSIDIFRFRNVMVWAFRG